MWLGNCDFEKEALVAIAIYVVELSLIANNFFANKKYKLCNSKNLLQHVEKGQKVIALFCL